MKITNRRIHLRWLLPLLVFFVAVTGVLITYNGVVRKYAARSRQTEMSFAIQRELIDVELSISRTRAALEASGEDMPLFAMGYNHNQILVILKGLVENTDASQVMICDLEGVGYDDSGKVVSIANEYYFDEISSEYSRGGVGMVLPNDPKVHRNTEGLVVCSVSFERKNRGYLIARIPMFTMDDKLFREKYLSDRTTMITMDGDILASYFRDVEAEDENEILSLWPELPDGLSKDTIKLAISQKNIYMSEVEGYGYVTVVPLKTINGGMVSLVKYDQMNRMIEDELSKYRNFTTLLVIAFIALIILMFLMHLLGNYLEMRRRQKALRGIETDKLTGLISKNSLVKAIEDYIAEVDDPKGLLFVVAFEGIGRIRADKGDTYADNMVREFAKTLEKRFRATDIVGRLEYDQFVVFLKDVHEDKDVRKQRDEMQMFLYDLKGVDAEGEFSANAGGALFPNCAKTAQELIDAGKEALEKSRELGKGMLSFAKDLQ